MIYNQLKQLIKDTLEYCKLKVTDNVVNMIAETACVESNCGQYIQQVNGPAVSIFQIEPKTAQDIIDNYLIYHKNLYDLYQEFINPNISLADNLKTNLMFAIFMCRCFYLRIKEPIPSTVEERAAYWKKYYNTYLGKGTINGYLEKVKKYGNVI